MLSSDCFLFLGSLGFFCTTIQIIKTCWFTIIFVCVCFKKNHNFVFSTTCYFFDGLRNTVNLPIVPNIFCKQFLLHHLFLVKLIHVIYRHNNLFKNTSSISFLIFISLSFNFLKPLNSLKSFSNYKGLCFSNC